MFVFGFGFFVGLLFAVFFPEPFLKFKTWVVKTVAKAKEL